MPNGQGRFTPIQPLDSNKLTSFDLCVKSEQDLNREAFQTIHLPLSPNDDAKKKSGSSSVSYALQFIGVHPFGGKINQEDAYGCIKWNQVMPIFRSPTFLSKLLTEQISNYARDKTMALQKQYSKGDRQYHCPGTTLSMALQVSNDSGQTWVFVTNIGYSKTFLATNAQGRWKITLLNRLHDISNRDERQRVMAAGGKVICKKTSTGTTYHLVGSTKNGSENKGAKGIELILTRSIGSAWIVKEHIKGHSCEPSTTMVAVDDNQKGFLTN